MRICEDVRDIPEALAAPNQCNGCKQTEGMYCEPISKKHPIGKCPGFI